MIYTDPANSILAHTSPASSKTYILNSNDTIDGHFSIDNSKVNEIFMMKCFSLFGNKYCKIAYLSIACYGLFIVLIRLIFCVLMLLARYTQSIDATTQSLGHTGHQHFYFNDYSNTLYLALANGKFVKYIVDLKRIKKENIKNENIMVMENTTNNIIIIIYNSLTVICISPILAVILSYKCTQSKNYKRSVSDLNIFATAKPSKDVM